MHFCDNINGAISSHFVKLQFPSLWPYAHADCLEQLIDPKASTLKTNNNF